MTYLFSLEIYIRVWGQSLRYQRYCTYVHVVFFFFFLFLPFLLRSNLLIPLPELAMSWFNDS